MKAKWVSVLKGTPALTRSLALALAHRGHGGAVLPLADIQDKADTQLRKVR